MKTQQPIALILVILSLFSGFAMSAQNEQLYQDGYRVVAVYEKSSNYIHLSQLYKGTGTPSFTAEGANLTFLPEKQLLVVYPTSGSRSMVAVRVTENGELIGEHKFAVKRVPMPKIWPANPDGTLLDLKQDIEISSGEKMLTISLQPDEDFYGMVPADAQFTAPNVTVTLARGREAVAVAKGTNAGIDYSDLMALAKPGDRLVIEVGKLDRQTTAGETTTHGLAEIFTIPLK